MAPAIKERNISAKAKGDICRADLRVSFQSCKAESFNNGVGEFAFEGVVRESRNTIQIKSRSVGIELEFLIFARGRILLVWAGENTIITAEQMLANILR